MLFAVSLAMRHGRLDEGTVPGGALALSVVAIVVLGASGWLGGKLSYRYGVRVADEAHQAEGYVVDVRDRAARGAAPRERAGTR